MTEHTTCNQNARHSAIANPYLKKPAAPEQSVFRENSNGSSSTSNVSFASVPQHAQQANEAPADGQPTAAAPVQAPIEAAQPLEKQTFGEKDAAVERLPSRNVSFGAAEILTVSELYKHAAASYVDRSVRITGVIAHRHVSSDGNVCLVLKDPLAKKQVSKVAIPRSILKTPGIQRRRLGSASTVRLVTRKRPLPSSLKKKAPPTPIDAVENIVNSLLNQQTILVYAVSKQMPVETVSVGDLVMIIGQVVESKQQPTVTIPAVAPIAEKYREKASTVSSNNFSFVHARILRNVNGTDMRLHDEALRLRRKHLQQTVPRKNEATPAPRAGLGPPVVSNNKTDNDVEMAV